MSALGLIFLGACSSEAVDPGCFPKAAKAQLPLSLRTEQEARASDAVIYIDGSGSIAGYVGNGGAQRPFEDLVQTLPELVGPGVGVDYRRIGTGITPIQKDHVEHLKSRGFYLCLPQQAPQPCDNDKSALDAAFAEIAAAPASRLSLIVTDLWFSNSESLVTSSVAYQRPLTSILSRGQSVIVYGVLAPYSGRLFDLPSGDANVRPARRPFYLVAIGPAAAIDHLHRKMESSGSRAIARGVADGTIPYSLFTTDPRDPTKPPPAFQAQGRGSGAVTGRKFVRDDRLPSQFVVKTSAIGDRDEGPVWSGPSATQFRAGAVWTGPTEPVLQVWRQGRGRCDFTEQQVNGIGWSGTERASARDFTLRPRELSRALGAGTFLLTGRVERTDLQRPSPASEWMRAWSFSEEEEASARARADFFPTLNLAELARLMEISLDEAMDRVPVAGFTALVKIQD